MIEPIDFGVVNDITTNVPSFNECRSTINVTFIPNRPETWINLKKNIHDILDDPDGYVLCSVNDIIKAKDELLKLKDRVKELENLKKEYDDLNASYINRGSKIECLELDLKDEKDKVNKYEKLFKDACGMKDYWYGTYYEAVRQSWSQGVSIRIVEANLKDNIGTVQVNNERAEDLKKENQTLKERNEELEKDFNAAVENAKFWHSRAKDHEKDCDYWNNRFTSITTDFANTLDANGVKLKLKGINGEGNWNVAIDIPKLNEAKKKITDLEKKLKAAKSNEMYWLHTYNLAVAQAANKGVRIFITGNDKENNVGVVLVKNEKVEELEKELKDLKSDAVAEVRYELGSDSFTVVCTMRDGSKQTTGIDFARDIDASTISCGTIPKCKSCKNHRYFANTGGHYCHLPDSRYTIPGIFRIDSLTDEEAEGPACDKFEARKEDDCKDCKYHIDGSWRSRKDGKAMAECKSPSTRYGFCKNNCNGEKACPEFERKE